MSTNKYYKVNMLYQQFFWFTNGVLWAYDTFDTQYEAQKASVTLELIRERYKELSLRLESIVEETE